MLRGWLRYCGEVAVVVAIVGLSPARAQPAPPAGEMRLALVIGNANYASAPLPTAANDAGLVAQTLAQAGFTVKAAGNLDGAAIREMFDEFLAKTKAAGPDVVTFVYLSGYGLQYDGDTFLVPVDAAPKLETDVAKTTVRLSEFVHAIEVLPAKAHIFVDDLARENPFVQQGEPLAGGLPLVEAPKGSLYAHNAAPGTIATPDVAPYGFYARALAEMIQEPGLSMSTLFERVRFRVSTLTDGAVIPWDDDKVEGDYSLVPAVPIASAAQPIARAAGTAAAAFWASIDQDTLAGYVAFAKAYPRDNLTARVRAIIAVRREALIWSQSSRANEPRAYWTYMRRYPRGPHLFDARRRLAALKAALEPPPRFDIIVYPDVPPPTPAEAAIVDHAFVAFEDPDWDAIPPPLELVPPSREAFYEDLPPPPVPPLGVLPIAVPVNASFASDGGAGNPAIGRIAQPGTPGQGDISIDSSIGPGRGSVMTMSAGSKVLSKTITTAGPGGARTIVQTGVNDALVSRTTTARDNGAITTIQTGPGGGILTKAVTRRDTDGGRSTILTNADGQTIARLQANRDGIVITTKRGPVPVLDQNFFVMPPTSVNAKPSVAPLARAPMQRPKTVDAGSKSAAAADPVAATDPGPRPNVPPLPAMAPTLPPEHPPPPPPPTASFLQSPVGQKQEPQSPTAPRKNPEHTTAPSRVSQPNKEIAGPTNTPRKEHVVAPRPLPHKVEPRGKLPALRLEKQRKVATPHQQQSPARPEARPAASKPTLAPLRPIPRPTRAPRSVSPTAPKSPVAAKPPSASKEKPPGRPRS